MLDDLIQWIEDKIKKISVGLVSIFGVFTILYGFINLANYYELSVRGSQESIFSVVFSSVSFMFNGKLAIILFLVFVLMMYGIIRRRNS